MIPERFDLEDAVTLAYHHSFRKQAGLIKAKHSTEKCIKDSGRESKKDDCRDKHLRRWEEGCQSFII